jgi:hypothetical protein
VGGDLASAWVLVLGVVCLWKRIGAGVGRGWVEEERSN